MDHTAVYVSANIIHTCSLQFALHFEHALRLHIETGVNIQTELRSIQ
jgi:hypothetical protein